jgi:hypothetical protein
MKLRSWEVEKFGESERIDRFDPVLFSAPQFQNFTTSSFDQSLSDCSTAKKALWGMLTVPTIFMRFLPFFCFSRSFLFLVMSPP